MTQRLADATVLTLGLTGSFWSRCDDATRPLIAGIVEGAAAGVPHLDAAVSLLRGTSESPVVCAGWRHFHLKASDITLLPAQYMKTLPGRAEPYDDREHILPDVAEEAPYPVAQVTDVDIGVAYWVIRCPSDFVPRCLESVDGPLLQGFDFIVHRAFLLFRDDPMRLFPGGEVVVSSARDVSRSMLSHLVGVDAPGRELSAVLGYRFLNHSRLSFFRAACAASGVGVSPLSSTVEVAVALWGGGAALAGGRSVETRATGIPGQLYADRVPSDEIGLVDRSLPSSSYFPIGLLLGGKWASVELAVGDVDSTVWEPDVGQPQLYLPFVRRLPNGSTESMVDTADGDTLNVLWSQSLVAAGWADIHAFFLGQSLVDAGYVADDVVTLDIVAGLVQKGMLSRLILIETSYPPEDPRSRRLKSYVDRERLVGLPSAVINVL